MKIPQSLTRLVSSALEKALGREGYGDLTRWMKDEHQQIQKVVNGGLIPNDNLGRTLTILYSTGVAGNAQTFQHPLGRTPVLVLGIPSQDALVTTNATLFYITSDKSNWTATTVILRSTLDGVHYDLWLI